MNISKMVVKNLTRRRGRFLFTLMGIAIGIAAVVTFLALGGSLKGEIQRETRALGANLVVTPKGSCAYEQVSILTGEQLPTTITREEVERIQSIKGLTALPFMTGRTAIQNRPVSVMGIVPDQTMAFKGWELANGMYFDSKDEAQAVVGAVIASRFGVGSGDTLTIRGQKVSVRGVLAETGGKDDLTIFVPLAVGQRIYEQKENVSYVAVRVDDLTQVESYAMKIKEVVNLGVVSDKQMLKSVLGIVGTVSVTLQLIAAVGVLAAAFGIVNTMMTATYERRREIGILQSMGARRRTIFSLFLLESGAYGVLGGLAGALGGLVISAVVAPRISQNAFTTFVKGSGTGPLIDPFIIGGAILLSAAVAILAGLYPALRAARLTPVEAISYE
ncbi:MAG: ABC transporter permease [Desulfobacterales bacterium]|nr:ABC transporter permease [Desulfobacterales bacterium]